MTYTVVAGRDTVKPEFVSAPKVIQKTLVQYGCGPSIHVVFSNPAKDTSDIIVKTIVTDLKTGNATTYYIVPDGDKIRVGHDMCSGAFAFDSGNDYEVDFSFMDCSGNITSWTGRSIRFTKPKKSTKHSGD